MRAARGDLGLLYFTYWKVPGDTVKMIKKSKLSSLTYP